MSGLRISRPSDSRAADPITRIPARQQCAKWRHRRNHPSTKILKPVGSCGHRSNDQAFCARDRGGAAKRKGDRFRYFLTLRHTVDCCCLWLALAVWAV